MDEKTVIIYASPKADSFTAKLLKEKFGDCKGAYFYNCFKALPHPCFDCGFCKTKEGCAFSDLDKFYEKFEKANRVIFAFPIYNCGLPAPLKALVDRFQRFYNARFVLNKRPPVKGEREVFVLMTCGSEQDQAESVLKQLTPMFTISGCTLKEHIIIKGTDKL